MTIQNMLSYILWNVNPDIFKMPFVDHPIRWYGVCWAVGFLVSQQVMHYIYKKEGKPATDIDTLTIYMVLAAMVGARLGHVLFYDPVTYFKDPIRILAVWEGGLASHGGAIGVFFGLYFFARHTKVKYLWILDRMTIAAAVTGCFIRIGNLMNSEIVGAPTHVPWAFIFPSVDELPRHPAQLYEALYCLLIAVILFYVWYRHRDTLKSGTLVGWFLIILFSLRFIDEFFKINQEQFEDSMVINMGQILSIPFVVAGIVILLLPTSRPEKAAKV